MKRTNYRSLRTLAFVAFAGVLLMSAGGRALAQSPRFPTVQPAVPNGTGPFATYGRGTGGILPPGAGLQLKPLPQVYRQPLPSPYRPYYNGPGNIPPAPVFGTHRFVRGAAVYPLPPNQ